MKEKRYLRALTVALAAACAGLLCCVSVFYLLWGVTTLTRLLPGVIFLAALALAIPVCLFAFRGR
ncbi:MAG: hypothetical protein IJK98_00045 [Clostridia bacterium]|nr:hypothetical protein [Clostridia bacterium]